MLGAIVGNIVGSVYEWDNINTKYFPLLIVLLIVCEEGLNQ